MTAIGAEAAVRRAGAKCQVFTTNTAQIFGRDDNRTADCACAYLLMGCGQRCARGKAVVQAQPMFGTLEGHSDDDKAAETQKEPRGHQPETE